MEIVEPSRLDFQSRISLRAVGAGTVVSLMLASLLMLLAGAVGLFPGGPYAADMIHRLNPVLGIWALVAWVIAAFFGGLLAAMIARSPTTRDGLLQGAVTWATFMLLGAVLFWLRLMVGFGLGLVTRDFLDALRGQSVSLALFITYVLALGSSLLGGALGARSEARVIVREPVVRRRPLPGEGIPTTPMPQPT